MLKFDFDHRTRRKRLANWRLKTEQRIPNNVYLGKIIEKISIIHINKHLKNVIIFFKNLSIQPCQLKKL